MLSSLPAGTAAPVMTAANAGVAAIQQRLALWDAVQNAWYGISLGSVLLLAAIGLAITFGVMGVINMAHGEMVMLGAYVTYVVQETIRTSAPALFDYSLAMAIPLAFLFAGLVGILIERCIIRFLYGQAAGNVARDLGAVAHSAAGRAHGIRAEQSPGRQSIVHERRVRPRRHYHHL